MMHRLLIAAVVAVSSLVAGCAGPSVSTEQRAVLEGPARTLEARGAWREAALAWQQAAAAQGTGSLAAEFTLNAADAYLEAGDGAGASLVASSVTAAPDEALALRRTLILADAALLSGDAVAALGLVGAGVASPDTRLLSRYRRIRSDALEVTGDYLGAARERALRESLLTFAEDQYRNRQRTWTLLARVPPEVLDIQPVTPAEPTSGWVELASLARRHASDAAVLEAAIADWSLRYPGHPAGEQIVPELVERVRVESQPPTKVALLLPQSGPFANAGAAVRDGFMAAWLADAPNPQRPEIVLRDSADGDVALTYAAALVEGAQFVVGPLTKDTVTAILSGADLRVLTLTLNYPSLDPGEVVALAGPPAADALAPGQGAPPLRVSPSQSGATGPVDAGTAALPFAATNGDLPGAVTPAPRDLSRAYHFALAPEDEAARAAEFAYRQGAQQAAVLAPQGAWGERVGDAFAAKWNELGGILAETQFYSEESTGLSTAVEELLNIDDSKQRSRDLRAVLVRNMEHDPEPRSDLDVIFMAAFPRAARQLRPLLLFHRAGAVPVVATSHVYAGTPDPQLDQDIEGVLFGDMPWIVSPDAHPLPGSVRRFWPDAGGAAGRLYAFGADAYALIAQIRTMRAAPQTRYPGMTGTLSVDRDRRIRRDLQWVQVREGAPITLDPGAPAWRTVAR